MNIHSRIVILIIFLCYFNLYSQESAKKEYELLVLEIEMFSMYSPLSGQSKELIDMASEYEQQGDFDVAVVFLEEVLDEIKVVSSSQKSVKAATAEYGFFGNFISGVDYNRQEFELGFDQSDSVLLDELTKPFVGFEVSYISIDQLFNISNSFRYDSENLRNELAFNNTFLNKGTTFNVRYGGSLDRNFEYEDLGYYEIFSEVILKSNDVVSNWYWQLKNYSRYKRYDEPSVSVPDYFRNSFSAYSVKNFDMYNSLQFDYGLEYNESLKYTNNDFLEHNGGIGYRDRYFSNMKIELESRYRHFSFNYQISDSAFENTSYTWSLSPKIIYDFSNFFAFNIDYTIDVKSFRVKTEQEPDYSYHFINPSLVFRLGDLSSLNVGYVYQDKKHVVREELVEQYIRDQDYHASGISAGFDYTTLSGVLVSLSVEYSQRRYPNFNSDADFSIYSNRNIFNMLLYAQLPLFKNITMNLIGSYDNDKDIDSDFNDTISSFYTIELTYGF